MIGFVQVIKQAIGDGCPLFSVELAEDVEDLPGGVVSGVVVIEGADQIGVV